MNPCFLSFFNLAKNEVQLRQKNCNYGPHSPLSHDIEIEKGSVNRIVKSDNCFKTFIYFEVVILGRIASLENAFSTSKFDFIVEEILSIPSHIRAESKELAPKKETIGGDSIDVTFYNAQNSMRHLFFNLTKKHLNDFCIILHRLGSSLGSKCKLVLFLWEWIELFWGKRKTLRRSSNKNIHDIYRLQYLKKQVIFWCNILYLSSLR